MNNRVIFSTRVARAIIKDGKFIENLVDIQEHKHNKARTVFIFKATDEFEQYILDEFDIK